MADPAPVGKTEEQKRAELQAHADALYAKLLASHVGEGKRFKDEADFRSWLGGIGHGFEEAMGGGSIFDKDPEVKDLAAIMRGLSGGYRGLDIDTLYKGIQPGPVEPALGIDTTQADANRDRLTGLLGQLQQTAATGSGPWEETFSKAVNDAQSSAQALGQAQANTGGNYQSALRNIGNTQSSVGQRAVGQEQVLRQKAKNQATTSLASIQGALGNQDVAEATSIAQANQDKLKLDQAELDAETEKLTGAFKTVGSAVMGGTGMSDGGPVPGRAQVFGDDEVNDTVPAKLSPGEIVIPRSITLGPDAPEKAAEFVRAVMQRKGGNTGPNFADGGTADNRPTHSGVKKDDWTWMSGFGPQEATTGLGALLDTTKYDQTRTGLSGLMDSLGTRTAGGDSVSDVVAQQRLDEQLEQQMGAVGPGSAGAAQLGSLAKPAVANASGAAEQRGADQAEAQQLLASTATDARARELALQQASHRQLLMHKAMNAGLDLRRLQSMQNLASGGAQGLAAITQFGLGSIKPEHSGVYQNDYYGDRGGAADLGRYDHGYEDTPGSDPGEWNSYPEGAGDYPDADLDGPQYAAEGGVISDDDERTRARRFLALLGGAA
jgi:hypothetical protein